MKPTQEDIEEARATLLSTSLHGVEDFKEELLTQFLVDRCSNLKPSQRFLFASQILQELTPPVLSEETSNSIMRHFLAKSKTKSENSPTNTLPTVGRLTDTSSAQLPAAPLFPPTVAAPPPLQLPETVIYGDQLCIPGKVINVLRLYVLGVTKSLSEDHCSLVRNVVFAGVQAQNGRTLVKFLHTATSNMKKNQMRLGWLRQVLFNPKSLSCHATPQQRDFVYDLFHLMVASGYPQRKVRMIVFQGWGSSYITMKKLVEHVGKFALDKSTSEASVDSSDFVDEMPRIPRKPKAVICDPVDDHSQAYDLPLVSREHPVAPAVVAEDRDFCEGQLGPPVEQVFNPTMAATLVQSEESSDEEWLFAAKPQLPKRRYVKLDDDQWTEMLSAYYDDMFDEPSRQSVHSYCLEMEIPVHPKTFLRRWKLSGLEQAFTAGVSPEHALLWAEGYRLKIQKQKDTLRGTTKIHDI